MIGDNPYSDGESAKTYGLRIILVPAYIMKEEKFSFDLVDLQNVLHYLDLDSVNT